ncbi:BTAD domain-containing putative transcriptional regulator [Streptomyces sp. NPDC050804]|uniref:AfsR/SARP family transcriptional regulator n=1 Tax=Streptomyces sp. NPDC050804 TaxID=3154745 RepID=UPI00343418EA
MSSTTMSFTVLGPVRAWRGLTEIPLGSPQQRVVMAALLLRQGAPVSAEDLVDAVWGDGPPASATNALRIYVHRLRRCLEPADKRSEPVIESVGSGYRVCLASDALDLAVFQGRVAEAQTLRREGDDTGARALLRSALALSRGSALADVPGAWAQSQRALLVHQWLDALEATFRVELRMGAHHELTTELAGTVDEHPFDERFREMLMVALYRSGRQAAALEVYQSTRALLAKELAISPGPALRHLHQRILRADPELLSPDGRTGGPHVSPPLPGIAPVPAPLTAVPAQLPYDLPVFAGRLTQLADVEDLAATASRRPHPGAALCVVTGSAGIGKTTFAVHAAHRLAPRYPDGQIYLNLHGYDAQEAPVSARRALRTVLEAFGVAADRLPPDVDAQAALYRSLLADRRVLLLLDNARDARQIRPLLPGASRGLVIVTSRDQMSALVVKDGAHHLRLDALSVAEARDLLVHRLGADRVDADVRATRRIIERSARLPLALALIAARAATRRGIPLTTVAGELSKTSTMLDVLSDPDSSVDVRSVFSWSYEGLSPETARLFRLLALAPTPDCSLAAVSALAALPASRVLGPLTELTASHLLDEPAPGRFVLHDLLREYARERLYAQDGEGEASAAFERLLAHHVRTAYSAARALAVNLPPLDLGPVPAGVSPEYIDEPEQAMAWFGRECETLGHLTERAGLVPGCETQAWQLGWSVMEYFQRAGRWDDQIALQYIALEAAGRGGDRLGQAHAHRNLARACTQTGRFTDALRHLGRALTAFEELGDLAGQARCHGNLALILVRQGSHAEALPHVRTAVEQFERAGDRLGQANALNNLGWTSAQTGDLDAALGHCRQALDLLQDMGDRVAEAATWDSLGYIHHHLGDYRQALLCYRRALDLDRMVGDAFNGAETMTHLGDTRLAMGDRPGAREAWTAALGVFEELDPEAAERLRTRLSGLDARADARCGPAAGDPAADGVN